MRNDVLKKAALAALEKELRDIPPESQLSLQYNLSKEFEDKMEYLISENLTRNISIFGKSYSRRSLAYPLYCIAAIISLWLYYSGKAGRNTSQLFLAVSFLAISLFFKDKSEIDSFDSDFTKGFERKYRPAFLDNSRNTRNINYEAEINFTLPPAPKGFVVKEEFRTSSRHIVNFCDVYGTVIHYVRNLKRDAVDYVDADLIELTETTVLGYPAIEYVHNGENHIMWEDSYFQYHIYGNVPYTLLRTVAGE